jgi:hypothetical protein
MKLFFQIIPIVLSFYISASLSHDCFANQDLKTYYMKYVENPEWNKYTTCWLSLPAAYIPSLANLPVEVTQKTKSGNIFDYYDDDEIVESQNNLTEINKTSINSKISKRDVFFKPPVDPTTQSSFSDTLSGNSDNFKVSDMIYNIIDDLQNVNE